MLHVLNIKERVSETTNLKNKTVKVLIYSIGKGKKTP